MAITQRNFEYTKVLHWKHPGSYAYFPGGNTSPNILGDMLSTAIGDVGFSWITTMSNLKTIFVQIFPVFRNLALEREREISKTK